MYQIKQGRPGQLPEIIAFAQNAFATTGAPVDFAALLPGLYGPGCQSEAMHSLLYEGERLEGLYALKILQLTVAGQPLRVGWLGTVAVGPEARGKGHLQRLMLHANQQLAAAGCHLGVLGGQRQRYQRFGYEYGGSQWQFTLSARNLQEAAQGEDVKLEPMGETSPWLQEAWAQYSGGPITGARSRAGFYRALCSWGARPWAILNNGRYAGYCTLEPAPDQVILREFCPLQGELSAAVCKAALAASGRPSNSWRPFAKPPAWPKTTATGCWIGPGCLPPHWRCAGKAARRCRRVSCALPLKAALPCGFGPMSGANLAQNACLRTCQPLFV